MGIGYAGGLAVESGDKAVREGVERDGAEREEGDLPGGHWMSRCWSVRIGGATVSHLYPSGTVSVVGMAEACSNLTGCSKAFITDLHMS